MAHRTIRDEDGRTWEVWATYPDPGSPGTPRTPPDSPTVSTDPDMYRPNVPITVPSELAAGWLVFVSGAERRRFAPVPDQWFTMSPAQLRDYLGLARNVDPFFGRPVRTGGA
jgi:hypothetical protein